MENPAMFCYQCQETARGTGCDKIGVCGKQPQTSARMDLLLYVVRGVSREIVSRISFSFAGSILAALSISIDVRMPQFSRLCASGHLPSSRSLSRIAKTKGNVNMCAFVVSATPTNRYCLNTILSGRE